MSYALVSAGSVANGSLSPSFGKPTTAGHLLVAWLFSNPSSATDPFTVTGAGWTQAVAGGGPYGWVSAWYRADCNAGEAPPVFSAGDSSNAASMLAEFSGGAASGPAGPAGQAGAVETATCTAPDSTGGDLIVYCCGWNGGTGATTITCAMADSSGAPVTPVTYADPGDVTGWKYLFAWGVAGPATGDDGDTCTGTLGAFSGGSCGIASFKPAAAASPAAGLLLAGII
jgi:hypothetical protein